VTAGYDGRRRIWTLWTAELIARWAVRGRVDSAAFSPDGDAHRDGV